MSTLRKVFLRGGSPYYYVRKYGEIARTLPEFVARKRLASQHAARASAEDLLLVHQLSDHGYVVLDRPLDFTDQLVAACNERLLAYQATSQKASGKGDSSAKFFWKTLLSEADLAGDSIFVRYALQERLVRCASMYLGEAAYLSSVLLQHSFEVQGNAPTHSQLWHKDFDDTRMFKVFVYCSDVLDEGDGPLNVADKKAPRGIHSTPLFASFRYNDARFYEIADRELTQPILGRAGTTFICDTQKIFHYGSRCHRPRLACWFTYQSYAGLYPAPSHSMTSPNSPFAYVLSRRIAASKTGHPH